MSSAGLKQRSRSASQFRKEFVGGGEIGLAGSGERAPARIATHSDPFPHNLRSQAPRTLRTHAQRSAIRVAVLLSADISVFIALRFILRATRSHEWLGHRSAALAETFLPVGTFPLVQSICATVLGLAVLGNYRAGDHRRSPQSLFSGLALGMVLVFWANLWGSSPWQTWIGFGIALLGVGTCIVAVRLLIDRCVRMIRPTSDHGIRTLLIGCHDSVVRIMRSAALQDPGGFDVVGFIDPTHVRASTSLGGISELVPVIERQGVDTIMLAGSVDEDDFQYIADVADATGCQLQALPMEFSLGRVLPNVVLRRGTPIVQLSRPGLRAPQLLLKRCFDLVLAVCALIVLSPLMAFIAMLVKRSSPGPVLFRQERVGRHARLFGCYKFRSMYVDAEDRLKRDKRLYAEYVSNDYKLPAETDNRITPIGRFLRRTSLDELPQLWNVVRGDMSLVGPRPVVADELRHYSDGSLLFLSLKPGLTGAWQVNGRSNVPYPARTFMELDYVRGWSLARDLSILLKTIPAVMMKRGAH